MNEITSYKMTKIRNKNAINIMNYDREYRPGKYEIRIVNDDNVKQYKILYNINYDCDKASFKFENFDDDDGKITLSEFCGKQMNSCESI